jgi:hypothetical protein
MRLCLSKSTQCRICDGDVIIGKSSSEILIPAIAASCNCQYACLIPSWACQLTEARNTLGKLTRQCSWWNTDSVERRDIDGACVKNPPRAGNNVCHAAFVSLLGGYEKSRSYTNVFVTNDAGTGNDTLELHRPIKIPMQSVTVKAQVTSTKRIADRMVDGGRESFSGPKSVYRCDEKVNGIFILLLLNMKVFSFRDLVQMQ